MITLLGIGHVFQLRDTVQGVINGKLPGLVCVELDEVRYKVIRSKQTGGVPPSFAYYMLARFEEKMADMYGLSLIHI